MHRDKTFDSVMAIDEWEKSALAKAGDLIFEYYRRFPPLPAEFANVWIASPEVAAIKADRNRRWGGHPQRWMKSDLPALCRDLDETPACADCQFMPLEELYAEHGPLLNFVVHGSAFAGLQVSYADLDHNSASMLFHSWHLAAIVGLVTAHSMFADRVVVSRFVWRKGKAHSSG